MKALFLDCFAGISGDMFLSALIDAGLNEDILVNQLKLLNLDGYNFTSFPVNKNGIKGTRVNIQVTTQQPHRHYNDIYSIISNSTLSDNIKGTALKIFKAVAEAEARVHGISINKVHFHEVGAIDSILDIVGAAIAVDILKPGIIYCNSLPLGKGFVKCEHGILPVPTPATIELVKGLPVHMGPVEGELVTPTGAAIVKTLVDSFNYPEIKIDKIGYGFGSKDLGILNALRVMIGKVNTKTSITPEEINVLECNIDDINPELIPYVQNILLEAGALDVYIQSNVMKKGRLGFQLKVICHPGLTEKLVEIIFKETTTLGIRFRQEKRFIIQRKMVKVPTPYGDIGIKIGLFNDKNYVQWAPEFKDCKAAAEKFNIPLKEVYKSAITEFENLRI